MRVRILYFFLLTTVACTVQKSSSTDVAPNTTNNIGSGATAQLGLWRRGPQQAADPQDFTLNSADDLESIPRQSVSLYDLSSASGKLTGPNLNVYYSKTTSDGPGKASPTISNFLDERIPWDSKEFKSFMLYAHGSKAIKYMKDIFPTINFSVRGRGVLPIFAYSSMDDNPLLTRYEINKDGRVGNILFYQEANAPTARFNPVDESDSVYHEFGHVFQHILNPNVLESGGNYDVDMLLEGLADFFAAAAVKDDRVLEYLASNAPLLFSANNRTGVNHQRRMDGSLVFPRDYVGDFHLDARIVSSALNDIRKYLEGQTVNSVKWSTTKPFNRSDAFDMANVLAHDALREIVPNSSIIHYSERVVAAVNKRAWSTQCGSSTSCKTEIVSEITAILKARGILSTSVRSTAFDLASSSPELRVNNNGNMYFLPLFQNSGDSNSDSVVDRCEAMLVIPNISLRSDVTASAYDTIFELYDTDQTNPGNSQAPGFSTLSHPSDSENQVIDILDQNEPYFDTSELEAKLWGFLLPGENIFSLAGTTTSRWYTPHQLSVLSPMPNAFNENNPPPVGWAFRAPASASATGYVEFAFSTRPFEVRYVTEPIYTIRSLRQKLTVSSSPANFCN